MLDYPPFCQRDTNAVISCLLFLCRSRPVGNEVCSNRKEFDPQEYVALRSKYFPFRKKSY